MVIRLLQVAIWSTVTPFTGLIPRTVISARDSTKQPREWIYPPRQRKKERIREEKYNFRCIKSKGAYISSSDCYEYEMARLCFLLLYYSCIRDMPGFWWRIQVSKWKASTSVFFLLFYFLSSTLPVFFLSPNAFQACRSGSLFWPCGNVERR